jgi:hypothetical protein
MNYICKYEYHEDEYENGEIVPLLDEEMFNSNLCCYCYEEQSERIEEEEALEYLDHVSPDAYEAREILSGTAY